MFEFFVKGKVSKAKLSTCVRGSLTSQVINRGMYTSGRDLRERANRPTPRTGGIGPLVYPKTWGRYPTIFPSASCRGRTSHPSDGTANIKGDFSPWFPKIMPKPK
ncbi:Uncharacterized protein Fot_15408 [Forsythia ovata]|uniref:Uncharacterized protein n=1 Tax=Forsythia ovata TaxID=205694 RepID=A0ABD1W9K9_9LAMI